LFQEADGRHAVDFPDDVVRVPGDCVRLADGPEPALQPHGKENRARYEDQNQGVRDHQFVEKQERLPDLKAVSGHAPEKGEAFPGHLMQCLVHADPEGLQPLGQHKPEPWRKPVAPGALPGVEGLDPGCVDRLSPRPMEKEIFWVWINSRHR